MYVQDNIVSTLGLNDVEDDFILDKCNLLKF